MTRRHLATQVLPAAIVCPLLGDAGLAQDSRAVNPRPSKRSSFFDERTRTAVDLGLTWLASRQIEEGSFGSGTYRHNLAVCGLAGMAFLSAGYLPRRGEFGVSLHRCVNYVLANTSASGFISAGFDNTRGPMYEHGFATLFLAEVYGNSRAPRLREKLGLAVRLIVDTQNAQGGWRYRPERAEADISVTVCQVMALRAAHNAGIYVPQETMERAIGYVKQCQNPDGGFSYMVTTPGDSRFPRSAAAVVAFYNAGIYEGAELTKGLDYLMHFPPGESEAIDRNYFFYAHYYAVQAMWHAGGRHWEAWYPAIRDLLLKQQQKGGFWTDGIGAEYATAMACLILRMPESYLPIFER